MRRRQEREGAKRRAQVSNCAAKGAKTQGRRKTEIRAKREGEIEMARRVMTDDQRSIRSGDDPVG